MIAKIVKCRGLGQYFYNFLIIRLCIFAWELHNGTVQTTKMSTLEPKWRQRFSQLSRIKWKCSKQMSFYLRKWNGHNTNVWQILHMAIDFTYCKRANDRTKNQQLASNINSSKIKVVFQKIDAEWEVHQLLFSALCLHNIRAWCI